MASGGFHWDDPLLLDEQLTDEERMVRDAARDYAQDRLAPPIVDAFRREQTDPGIFKEMGDLGLLGATIPAEFGGGGLNYVCYGLIAREVSAGRLQRAEYRLHICLAVRVQCCRPLQLDLLAE